MNFYPIYKNKKLLPWLKWWIIKGNKITPKQLSEWINSASPITLTGVYKGSPLLYLSLKGNTSQTGTPTPEEPVPVNVVKGNNTITINDTGYHVNLKSSNLYKGYDNLQSGWLPNNGVYPTTNSSYPNAKYQLIELKNGESITLSNSTTTRARIRYIDKDINQVIGTVNVTSNTYFTSTGDYSSGFSNGTITAKKDFVLGILVFEEREDIETVMINEGSTATTYEPYYDYELCKIGDYQDVIYKEDNKWYVDKYISKVVITDTNKNIVTNLSTQNDHKRILIDKIVLGWQESWDSNIAILNSYKEITSAGQVDSGCFGSNFNRGAITIWNDNFDDLATAQSLLIGTEIYIRLATSTTTEITETNLVAQLEAIYNATLISGTNTITQTPADLPFYLSFRYYEKG